MGTLHPGDVFNQECTHPRDRTKGSTYTLTPDTSPCTAYLLPLTHTWNLAHLDLSSAPLPRTPEELAYVWELEVAARKFRRLQEQHCRLLVRERVRDPLATCDRLMGRFSKGG